MGALEPVKRESQNVRILRILESGIGINTLEAQEMGITALNSRISDLRNKHNIKNLTSIYEPASKCYRYYLEKPHETQVE